MLPDCRSWATQHGAVLFAVNPAEAFGFGLPDASLSSWSDRPSSGVFLGELYRQDRVRAELSAVGVDGGRDDVALVAASYATWGEEAFGRLEGIFCVALWDPDERKLVLYRDATCARSLYWYQGEGWVAVGTRLDILNEVPGLAVKIGAPGLHEYLRFLDISPPNTIFQQIRALEPGQTGRSFGAGVEYRDPGRWRELGSPRVGPGGGNPPPFETCLNELDAALRASVAARLDSAGPTAVFLSGGIDSALLCAIAADLDRDRINAFTVGFEQGRFDETPVAAGIAAYLGIRHHRLCYDDRTYAGAFERFVESVDVPFADPAGLPTWLMFHDCREVADVALDGTGADTLVGVMPARHIRIATQYAARLPAALRRLGTAMLRRIPALAGYTPILDFDLPQNLLIRWHGWSQAEIEALCRTAVSLDQTRFFRLYRQFSASDHFGRYSALLGNLPDDRIHQAAEVTGLRVRFPYWDAEVERIVRGLPQSYRYTEAQPKRLLRALLARYLPRPLWDLPKHGFDFPFVAFLRRDDHALVRRYLDPAILDRFELVRGDLVERYVRQFVRGDDELGFRIWGLVVLFAWLESHSEPR